MTTAKDEWKELGARLREAREYRGYSQEDIANCLNISRSSVSLLENGERKIDSVEMKKLADFYDTSVDALIGDLDADAEMQEEVALLARAAEDLSPEDREEVLRFAEFLKSKGGVNDTDG